MSRCTFAPLNYTPHDVTIETGDGKRRSYPSVGVCRAESRQTCALQWSFDYLGGVEVHQHGWATPGYPDLVIMNPPEFNGLRWTTEAPAEGADVIVSIVAAPVLVAERPDLRVFVPDTGPASAIRGGNGQIEAIRRLILWHDPHAETHRLRLISETFPGLPDEGMFRHSRHELTPDGVVDLLYVASQVKLESAAYMEVADPDGSVRQSAILALSHLDIGRPVSKERVDELWAWVRKQRDIGSKFYVVESGTNGLLYYMGHERGLNDFCGDKTNALKFSEKSAREVADQARLRGHNSARILAVADA